MSKVKLFRKEAGQLDFLTEKKKKKSLHRVCQFPLTCGSSIFQPKRRIPIEFQNQWFAPNFDMSFFIFHVDVFSHASRIACESEQAPKLAKLIILRITRVIHRNFEEL